MNAKPRMRVAIMQPAYLPWSGHFARIFESDAIIFLDNVTPDLSSKHRFIVRNRIMGSNGPIMLSLPIPKGAKYQKIHEIGFAPDTNSTIAKHRATIDFEYKKKSPYYEGLRLHWEPDVTGGMLNAICGSGRNTPEIHEIARLLMTSTLAIFSYLTWLCIPESKRTSIFLGSALSAIHGLGHLSGDALLLGLCKTVGATEYVSGPAGLGYIDPNKFLDAGITPLWHEYTGAGEYKHLHTCAFDDKLSILDLLLCNEPSRVYKILMANSKIQQWTTN